MTNTIRAIKVTRKGAEIVNIENSLEALQAEVGGYIEAVTMPEGSWFDVSYESEPEFAMTIICNEEGKIMELDPTLVLGEFKCGYRGGARKVAYDTICGTALIVDQKCGEFISLSNEQIEIAMDWIKGWHIDTWEDME